MAPNEFQTWLSGRLDRLENTQVEIKADLAEHMARTEAAEENLEMLRSEVKPLTAHVAIVAGVFKAFLGLGSVASALYGIAKLLSL